MANFSPWGPGFLTVLRNLGAGTFTPKDDYPVGTGAFAVELGDLNQDGRADLAVADWARGSVHVLLAECR